MTRQLTVRRESWPLAGVFTIARGSRTDAKVLVVEIRDGDAVGCGECVPYPRYGESLDSVAAQIAGVAPDIEGGAGRDWLQSALHAGAARNAVDCALWDLEAKQAGRRIWDLAGLPEPAPVITASLSVRERLTEEDAEDTEDFLTTNGREWTLIFGTLNLPEAL